MIAITHRNPELLLVNGTPPTLTPSLRPWRPALYLHFGRWLEALSSTSYRWICQAQLSTARMGPPASPKSFSDPDLPFQRARTWNAQTGCLKRARRACLVTASLSVPRSSRGRNPRRGIDARLGQLLRNPAMLSAMLLLGWPRRGWPRTGMRLTGGATSSSATGCKSKGMGVGPPNIAAPIRAS